MRINHNKTRWLVEAVKAHGAAYGTLPPLEQPCLVWPWGKTRGYGVVSLGNGRKTQAHRYAYELVNGPFPDGLNGLHHCDNPPCFNPAHIYAGTQADNIRDCTFRGRHNPPRGERHSSRKLSADQVRQILELKGLLPCTALGCFYRVSFGTIAKIWRGQGWRHIPRQKSIVQSNDDFWKIVPWEDSLEPDVLESPLKSLDSQL